MAEKPKEKLVDKTSSARQSSFLAKLKAGGGAPVRVDFDGPTLNDLDELVAHHKQSEDGQTVKWSRAVVIRDMVRKARAKLRQTTNGNGK
jgi:hypothetical protein